MALLLTSIMLVTGTVAAADSSAMALDRMAMSGPMTHCHHHTVDMTDMDMGGMAQMNHDAPQDQPHCPDQKPCQCLTLCQLGSSILPAVLSGHEPPRQHFIPGPVVAVSPGVHQLPLRPPSLIV